MVAAWLARLSSVRSMLAITVATVIALILLSVRATSPTSLWLSPDQQGRIHYEDKAFAEAALLFENSMWQGRASYAAGQYEEAAESFARVPSATAFYNRGNALMRGFDYGQAIAAYELAVAEDADFSQATENLELARYTLEYIEKTREQSDTGDESELGADDYKFDNSAERGLEMVITEQSTIELESAEKWMRAVDTETRDFLRSRFALQADLEQTP